MLLRRDQDLKGDGFENEIKRLKQEAEVLAKDPNYNPYLLLPERQHDSETQLFFNTREPVQAPRFEPRFDTYNESGIFNRSRGKYRQDFT